MTTNARRALHEYAYAYPDDPLTPSIKEALEHLLDYENSICWNTSCLNCAQLLDQLYNETCLREQAELKAREAEEMMSRRDYYALAEALSNSGAVMPVVEAVAYALVGTNPRYDRYKFTRVASAGLRTCPTPCDADCDAECHESHKTIRKRTHKVGDH